MKSLIIEGGLLIIQNKTYYNNAIMLWDFFGRINNSILLNSRAHKEIFTWPVFNAHDLIIITPVKRRTQCTCLIERGLF